MRTPLRRISVWIVFFTGTVFGQTLERTNQYTVTDSDNSDAWTRITLSSDADFLLSEPHQTVYAHPGADGVAEFAYSDMSGFDPEWYRFDGVNFLGEASSDPVTIGMRGTLTGTLYYSYHAFSGWHGYTVSSTIRIKEPSLKLETTAPDGQVHVLFWEMISAVTDKFNYLNNSYHFNLGMGVGEDRLFAANLPVHMTLIGSADGEAFVILDGGSQTTDENGNVTFALGGDDVYLHCTGPTDFIELKVQAINPQTGFESYAYIPYEGRIPGDWRFFEGTLTVAVKDVCGNPLPARVKVSGGPVNATSRPETYTDAAGHAEFVYSDPEGGWQLADVKILPVLDVEGQITQIIDAPDALITSRPCFLNGMIQLTPGAYSFKPGDSFGDLTLKLFRDDTRIETDDFTVKRTYTDDDRRKGRDRYRFCLPVKEASATYRVEAYLNDTDGKEALVGSARSEIGATARPAGDRTLQFQYVPIDPQKAVGDTSWLESYVQRILPVKVGYSTAPPLKPDLWPWEGDVYRLSGWYRELERYRVSQNPAPDLVIGIVPPGGLATYFNGTAAGLSMDGYAHVVLLDLSHTKSHHLLHEYLHTLGLPDNYGGTYPPACAPGYTEQGHRIWNAPNTSPLNCAVMYDFAPIAWPTAAEYSAMLTQLTESTAPLIAFGGPLLNGPPVPEKVILVSGMIEDTAYGSMITRRSPVFVDDGAVWAPQEVAPGHWEASGVRLLADGTEVAKAYLSNNMNFNAGGGSVDMGGILGMINFAVPWQSGVDTIEFCKFTTDGYVMEVMYDSTIAFSENAPTAAWADVPATGSTLAGTVELAFEAADTDADSSLWAWVKVSTDDGQTFRPAGNSFAIEPGANRFTLDCSEWPESDACRIRLLVSDDGNTTAIETGPYVLNGYNPNPVVRCDVTAFERNFTVDEPVILALNIGNEGAAELECEVQAGSLPEWLRCETVSAVSVLAGAERTVFFVAEPEPNTPESYNTAIDIQTNDPARPVLSIPVQLQYSSGPEAPYIVWAGMEGGYRDGGTAPMAPTITVLARDGVGRDDLNAWLTVMKVSNGLECIVGTSEMENTGMPGMYSCTVALPERLAGERIAFEFEMQNPATGLCDDDGLKSGAYDFTLDLIRPNNPPRFTQLVPELEEYDYIYTGFGQSLDLSFTLDEPDGDFVYYMIHSGLPLELDPQAQTLHCVIPLLDDPYEYEVVNQAVELIAVDRFGAQTRASWQLYISPYNRINNRAYPYYSSTVIDGDFVELQAFSFSALEGQYCRMEWRPVGSATWMLIGEHAYDQEHPGIYADGRMAVIGWDTSTLAPGAAVEVRFVDYWPGGSPDSEPPTVVFRKARIDGGIVAISAPAQVAAGEPFDLFVEVQNRSAGTWTLSDGYRLVPPSGVDLLTGLVVIEPAVDFAQVVPGGTVLYHARAAACADSGVYNTTWRLVGPDGPLGEPVSRQVRVVSESAPAMPGDISGDKAVNLLDLAQLLSSWGLTPEDAHWNPACDLHPDSQIDILDLTQIADYWLERF